MIKRYIFRIEASEIIHKKLYEDFEKFYREEILTKFSEDDGSKKTYKYSTDFYVDINLKDKSLEKLRNSYYPSNKKPKLIVNPNRPY